jgi:hypothetical protein
MAWSCLSTAAQRPSEIDGDIAASQSAEWTEIAFRNLHHPVAKTWNKCADKASYDP